MGFLTPDDPGYDSEVRQTGFNRYKQCLSFYAVNWMKVNLITVAGALPLTVAVTVSILSSSILLLFPGAFVCGMIFGPFLAGLYDAVLRGLRDDSMNWWEAYQKSWRQNWRDSLLPGGILGLLTGLYCFMGALLWWSRIPPTAGTLALYVFSGFLVILFSTLYWSQIVLFQQTAANRIRNMILFTVKYFWRVTGVALLQTVYILLYILFAPWTIILVPFLGFWYIVFAAQFLIYEPLNRELRIEEKFSEPPESSGTEE